MSAIIRKMSRQSGALEPNYVETPAPIANPNVMNLPPPPPHLGDDPVYQFGPPTVGYAGAFAFSTRRVEEGGAFDVYTIGRLRYEKGPISEGGGYAVDTRTRRSLVSASDWQCIEVNEIQAKKLAAALILLLEKNDISVSDLKALNMKTVQQIEKSKVKKSGGKGKVASAKPATGGGGKSVPGTGKGGKTNKKRAEPEPMHLLTTDDEDEGADPGSDGESSLSGDESDLEEVPASSKTPIKKTRKE